MTIRITKVYDYDCPICEHMLTFDGNVIFNLGLKTHYGAVELGTLINSTEPWNAVVFMLLERHAVNDDYTIDLPVYLVTEGTNYLGHVKGENTQDELRTKLQEILSRAENKKGASTPN
jgi:hypothetical protein